MDCPNCGSINREGAEKCSLCFAELNWSAEPSDDSKVSAGASKTGGPRAELKIGKWSRLFSLLALIAGSILFILSLLPLGFALFLSWGAYEMAIGTYVPSTDGMFVLAIPYYFGLAAMLILPSLALLLYGIIMRARIARADGAA